MTTEQQSPPAATSFSFESIILTTPAGEAYDITELVLVVLAFINALYGPKYINSN